MEVGDEVWRENGGQHARKGNATTETYVSEILDR